MTPTITSESSPDSASILKADVQYHFGDASAYDFKSLADVAQSGLIPDNGFACFSVGAKEFYVGDLYKQRCEFA